MGYLKRRGNGFQFQVQVPTELIPKLRPDFQGRRLLITKGLDTTDHELAKAKALELAGRYKAKFAMMRGTRPARSADARKVYELELARLRERKPEGEAGRTSDDDGIDGELDALLDQAVDRGWRERDGDDPSAVPPSLPDDLQARWDATVDYRAEVQGRRPESRDAYALAFSETAARYLESRSGSLKGQTVAQHEATYRLFADFVGDKPLAKVARADAVKFFDEVREFHPAWGRSPETKQRTFAELKHLYAGKGKRLSDKTLVRYASHLLPLWDWANAREQFAPATANPFAKLVKKPKRKSGTYLPLELSELNALFGSVPERSPWLWEIALVALYSGMRANEICSLSWSDVKKSEGVWHFDITEAKSEAGKRKVPVHSRLAWLLARRPKKGAGQIWLQLKPTGPDKKYSAYYTKRFTAWRRRQGVTDDRKVFHSLRKNVVQCLERARVQQSDAAQIVGHERAGITYDTYSPHGLTMKQRRDIVEKIKYPGFKPARPPASPRRGGRDVV